VPPEWDKIVVVTRKTGLEELLERFVTHKQARFYLEHSGVPFEPYEEEQRAHDEALNRLKAALPAGVRSQFIKRSFLPTFAFGERDLVVTLGPDGMVVNVAKYLRGGQPILAFNPDPSTVDGILIAFRVGEAGAAIRAVLRGDYRVREVTMAAPRSATARACSPSTTSSSVGRPTFRPATTSRTGGAPRTSLRAAS